MRHDEAKDLTTEVLKEICYNRAEEYLLFPVRSERPVRLTWRLCRTMDVSDKGFFDPMNHCRRESSFRTPQKPSKQEKCCVYEKIQNVDQSAIPGVFMLGGMGQKPRGFPTKLAEILAETQ